MKIETLFQNSKLDQSPIIVNGQVFTYKATGNTRVVFENEDRTYVVKVDLNRIDGNFYNQEEFEHYQSANETKKLQLAETILLENGYIIQEWLNTLDDDRFEKRRFTFEEIRFAASCRSEVGFDKNGNLKCFDLPEFKKY